MQIDAVDHAAIKTAKLEETRVFFVEALGLKVGPRPRFDFRGYWLYAGGRDIVHLVETETPKAPSSVAAINHIALRVADFEATLADLKTRGIAFSCETTPGGELRELYVIDPNGVRIELNAPGATEA
ncbi:VOC family protein [Phenylobacterium sp.]|jgi:catechol 2,3-dioxygenase-like lactoylglutathione lyase family enzyme|uniref:VOC family protein n=1 Tax=Phenylobacterium sp. TaxID=1871053 RepID=UPI002E348DD7|nr:VOC family protein [Phenylobacterium sp.]HEX3365701.1 VOC family protein [Phenylobacterium sp.]